MRISVRREVVVQWCMLLAVLERTVAFMGHASPPAARIHSRHGTDHRSTCGAYTHVHTISTDQSRRRQRGINRKNVYCSCQRKGAAACMILGSSKNWDEILAQEDEGEGGDLNEKSWKTPVDMAYNQRNCERSNKNYAAIKRVGGPAADLYGCVSTTANEEAVFWFLGKVAHVSDVSLEQCVARQWPLIQHHAANLRPLELFPAVSSQSLELWCAPAGSEIEVAYNRPTVQFQKMAREVPGADSVKANFLGFQGEVYDRGEDGFRTWRLTADGRPSRPEIVGPPMEDDDSTESDDEPSTRAPTDQEMEQLQKAFEGKDINELYEEQERRASM